MTSLEYDRALEEQASALTTCSICTDVFKVPKVLPCQHTFCLCCLERHHDATNSQRLVPVSSFACPTCRKVCYVPRHSLDQLPTDFKVDQILDLVKVMSRSRSSSLSSQKSVDVHGQGEGQVPSSECVVCRSARAIATPSEVFCVQCARSFCSACAEHHSRTSVFQDHTVVPVGAASSCGGAWRCALHDLEVQYFCDQCVAPSCAICVLSIHGCHPVSDQRTVVSKLRGHLTKSFEKLKQRRDEFKLQLDEVALLRQEHLRTLQETERAVLRSSREAYRKIRELEETTLMDVRSCNREKLERMDTTERELSARLDSLTQHCHSYSDVLALTNLKTFFDSYSQLAVMDEAEAGDTGPEVDPAIRDVSTFVARIQVRLGEVEKRVIDVEALPKAPQKGLDGTRATETESKRTTTARKDAEQPRPSSSSLRSSPETVQGQGHDQGQGKSEGQGKGQRRERREVPNTVEHRQLHSSNNSINTSVNSTNSSRTNNAVGNESNNCSTSSTVAPNSGNSSSSSSIKSTKSSNVFANVNSTSSLNSNADICAPRNSTTTTTNNNSNNSTTRTSNTSNNNNNTLRTSNNSSNRHAVERSKSTPRSSGTKNMNVIRSTQRTSGNPQLLWVSEDFSHCRDCAFTSNGQLVATDHAVVSNRVKMFTSSDGQLVDTVDSCLIVQPWGLCYNDSTSSILLTDHGNPSLKTVRVGSTREVRVHRCQCDLPSGVAVTRSGDLVLTETGSRRFKVGVYSIVQGRMSRTREFGCQGDGEGEVLRANYVIVDHNDRVIVSDAESHTVKVFSLTGQQLLKFCSSSADGREMCPQGVAVDDSNNILVADQASGAVVKYSPHGQLIDTVVQTSGLPWGISVSWEENRLAVATDRGLEVYRL